MGQWDRETAIFDVFIQIVQEVTNSGTEEFKNLSNFQGNHNGQ